MARDRGDRAVQAAADAAVTNFFSRLIDDIAHRTADIVEQRLRTTPGHGAPLYATAKNNPLGSARAFLNAHRSRAFKTFRQGRQIAARWADVEEWMQQRAESAPPSSKDTLLNELQQAARAPRRKMA